MQYIIQDSMQMQLIEKDLSQVRVDSENWLIYFINKETAEKWIKEYLNSGYHGGGTAQLRKIEKFPWE